jgi:murein DD-endopeptidase MepM/ murein hydrolase activator NlpD
MNCIGPIARTVSGWPAILPGSASIPVSLSMDTSVWWSGDLFAAIRATLNADRAARQSDLDQENATLAQVQAGLDQLTSIQATLDDLTSQLSDLISQIQDAVAGLPADLTASLAQVIEQSEQSVIAQVEAAAWAEANAGAGLATDLLQLPTGSGPSGITFSWPMVSFQVTQPFGPTTFALEPPLGPYPHFHTGIDIAAARGTPVLAAADGIVVAVWHTGVGYGNYVIIAHGSEVLSLYAHLDETDVTLGQKILRTQIIGREGSTGWSTGPHVHFEIRFHNQFVDPAKYLPPA